MAATAQRGGRCEACQGDGVIQIEMQVSQPPGRRLGLQVALDLATGLGVVGVRVSGFDAPSAEL